MSSLNYEIREKRNAIVKNIADRIFTNVNKDVAERLVLELPGNRDGGGWCRESFEKQVYAALCEEDT